MVVLIFAIWFHTETDTIQLLFFLRSKNRFNSHRQNFFLHFFFFPILIPTPLYYWIFPFFNNMIISKLFFFSSNFHYALYNGYGMKFLLEFSLISIFKLNNQQIFLELVQNLGFFNSFEMIFLSKFFLYVSNKNIFCLIFHLCGIIIAHSNR